MFFDGWSGLLRVLVVGSFSYAALILFLRISGKRTLTKLNAFDLVITVSLGSTLSSIVLTKSVALSEGLLALALLIALQYLITWSSLRSPGFQKLIKAEPTLLLRHGELIPAALRRERVTSDEVLAAVRAAGVGDIAETDAVILETDGSISVVRQTSMREGSLANVATSAADAGMTQPDGAPYAGSEFARQSRPAATRRGSGAERRDRP